MLMFPQRGKIVFLDSVVGGDAVQRVIMLCLGRISHPLNRDFTLIRLLGTPYCFKSWRTSGFVGSFLLLVN